MTRRRRTFRRLLWRGALALAALALPASAAAGVHLGGVDPTAYPEIQATVVTSQPAAQAPALTEDGAPVAGFTAQNLGREKAVVLALDRSRSMAGAALADATAAARTFVGLKNGRDQLAVVAFGRRAVALTGFSSSPADADAALGAVAVDRRSGTALYDAVVLAADRLGAQPLPGRVIVLLTDGHDVSSTATLDDAIAAARRTHVDVYPIAVSGAGFDAAPLLRLARATGGSYHRVGSTALLARVYGSIANELARTWRLRYTTAARPGETIRLRASLPPLGAADATLRLPVGLGGVAATPPAPSPLVPAQLDSPAGTVALAGAVALLVAIAAWLLGTTGGRDRVRARIEAHVAPTRPGAAKRRSGSRQGFTRQIVGVTERAFGNLRQFRSLQRLLERADLPLRAAELLYIQLGAGVVLGLLFAVAGSSPVLTLAAMGAGGAAPLLLVRMRARRRLRAFENQLPDLLITIAASLKAGHSFRQGLQTVVDEGRPPASAEFRRVLTETSLGRPMDDALADMSGRVGSKNLDFVITAVTIQRQVGGSLAGLFDMVADAVRQRQAFTRKIRGLTAMGRMSAYVLVGLPFFLALLLTLMNPAYMAPLYHTSTGHLLIFVGLGMMSIGSVLLKKLVSFKG